MLFNHQHTADYYQGSYCYNPGDSRSFKNVFRSFAALRSLNLKACQNLTSKDLVKIMDHCTQLKELNIDNVDRLSNADMNLLIARGHGRLRKLWINCRGLKDETLGNLDHLAETLELLSISDAVSLRERGMHAIGCLANLTNLRLQRATGISAAAYIQAFSDGRLMKLRSLDLTRSVKLSDNCLKVIALNCPNLSVLTLIHCKRLTGDGLWYVVNSCRRLTWLNLKGLERLVILNTE